MLQKIAKYGRQLLIVKAPVFNLAKPSIEQHKGCLRMRNATYTCQISVQLRRTSRHNKLAENMGNKTQQIDTNCVAARPLRGVCVCVCARAWLGWESEHEAKAMWLVPHL